MRQQREKLDPRRNTPRHIIITLPKIKRKDLHPRVTEIHDRVEQGPLLPLGPTPTYSITVQPPALLCPGEHLRLRPFMYQVR